MNMFRRKAPVEFAPVTLADEAMSAVGFQDAMRAQALTELRDLRARLASNIAAETKALAIVDEQIARVNGWTEEEDPVKVEHAVGGLFMRKDWTMLSHVVIFHGRRTCHAKRPACGACPVARLCPSYGIGETDPAKAAKLLKFELAPQ